MNNLLYFKFKEMLHNQWLDQWLMQNIPKKVIQKRISRWQGRQTQHSIKKIKKTKKRFGFCKGYCLTRFEIDMLIFNNTSQTLLIWQLFHVTGILIEYYQYCFVLLLGRTPICSVIMFSGLCLAIIFSKFDLILERINNKYS